MSSYLFLILLLFLPQTTTPQFSTCDIRGTTPTLPCNYCTLSPSITIGANATLPPTPQTTSVGLYSTTVNVGSNSPATNIGNLATSGFVVIGNNVGGPSTQDINIGDQSRNVLLGRFATTSVQIADYSPSTTVATGPTAGPVTIGISSPTSPAPTQAVTIADYSATLRLGRFANSIVMGISPTAPSIVIGANTPTPTPTTIQNINICPWCSTLSLGSGNTGGVSIATGPTAGPVTIGSPTANPGQNLDLGRGAYAVDLGAGTPTFKHSYFAIGQQFQVASTPTMPDVYASICPWDDFVYIAEYARTTNVASGPTAGPVTIGRTVPAGAPTLAGSNKINLLGLYHYYYSAGCPGAPSGYADQTCTTDSFTNGPTTASPTGPYSGFDATNGRWYPPEVGIYSVTFTGLASGGGDSFLFINRFFAAAGVTVGYAKSTVNTQMTADVFIKFDGVGNGYYISLGAQRTVTTAGYSRVNIVRVA